MSRLFESIQVTDHTARNLDYHFRRMHRSAASLWDGKLPVSEEDIARFVDDNATGGIQKLRLVYNREEFKMELIDYVPRAIQSYRLVISSLSYDYKYLNRYHIDRLARKKSGADDIIIVRHGLVTDSSIANLAFLKNNAWYTPESPLLKGTRRAKLLDDKLIAPARITPESLRQYELVSPINAMLDLGQISLPVKNILPAKPARR